MKKITTFLKLLPILLLFSLAVPAWASSVCNATTWKMTFFGPIPVCEDQEKIEKQTTLVRSSDKNKPEKPPFSFFRLFFSHLLW
ncbi:hypothetical protein [Candidatus Regiella insecticola]|uniref:hypothetical protein n=1 Tax=Candidatus Regiella insecticola TaxID=138073 RepID=UPI00159663DF|nr:hypothetical protein [Candidatus Regiella insecticola]